MQRCLFCSGDASEPNHLDHCDGRQGRVEAEIEYEPIGHARSTDPDTSHAAANAIGDAAKRQCSSIRELIRASPRTCEELEILTGWRHQSVSRRITDLREQGFVYDSGERRRATSGRSVIVWKAKTG